MCGPIGSGALTLLLPTMRSDFQPKNAIPFWLRTVTFSFCLALAACSMGVVEGCGASGSSAAQPAAAGVPAITSVAPATVPAGSGPFTLEISGSGFAPQSIALWNGTSLTTIYISPTKLTAAVPASLASSTGAFTITVANPGGQSSSGSGTNVDVDNPAPTITSLSPQLIPPGSAATDVAIIGT